MPQLSPLPWVFSFMMVFMLIMSMLIIYFIKFKKMSMLSKSLIKMMSWCW
uniref:ATP synthase F0 subunit 8 n=1 Tax=Zephyrarchaea mainae TaxID=1585564 RepID=H2E4K0_9ARAC|nr:ATP synthase F0 subunit 8 [Austrarchaea mainae]AEX89106.1 ATP synthase F0 subunit 8 [Austrarchaea mainae]AEX89112.1 ATP synthase F0 subunit 8 [Austrarchaea mainae]AEX89127.1 ATP synthase F0 subunit 8 [Austrarchaea mainae]AEX89136.1 ATP synthase F0 subunit 8 [Austrarchaea mainae]